MSERIVEIRGIPELLRKLDNPEWVAGPMGALLDRWRFATQRKAVGNIKRGPGGWLDTGDTRRSLTSERDQSGFPVWAKVGSNKDTARIGEYGAGKLSDDPNPRPWRAPSAAELGPWAQRKGLNPFAVSRSMARRGGIAPRRFLRDAADTTEKHIPAFVKTMAREIEEAASRGVD